MLILIFMEGGGPTDSHPNVMYSSVGPFCIIKGTDSALALCVSARRVACPPGRLPGPSARSRAAARLLPLALGPWTCGRRSPSRRPRPGRGRAFSLGRQFRHAHMLL